MSILLFVIISIIMVIPVSAVEQINISVEKDRLLLFEPVHLIVKYEGEKYRVLNVEIGEIEIQVTNIQENSNKTYLPLAHYDYDVVDQQGKHYNKEVDVSALTVDRTGWLFEKPGLYQVTATIKETGTVSNTIEIQIVEPTINEDLIIMEKIKKCREMAMFVGFEGGDMFEDAMSLAENIAHTQSSYAPQMKILMAKNYLKMSCDKNRNIRQPQLKKALSYILNDAGIEGHLKNGHLSTMKMVKLFRRMKNDSDYDNRIDLMFSDVVEKTLTKCAGYAFQGVIGNK